MENENALAQQESLSHALLRLLLKAAAIGLIIWALLTFVFGVHFQRGNSMYPFLMDGDVVIFYRPEKCRVGDVTAYRSPETGKIALSRVAAMGAHEIRVTSFGELLIDGFVPNEAVFYPTEPLPGSMISYPYRMEEGEVFLLDDFREEGRDSRIFGAVKQEDLLGKVVYLFRRRGF